MHRAAYYIINGITLYRLLASVILMYLIISDQPLVFRWFLAASFFTDAIDGFLARRFKVASSWGSRLDSIADDVTVLMALIGIFVFDPGFLEKHMIPLLILALLFVVQLSLALIRYKKPSSFHTYLAKAAAIAQGFFLILFFFLPSPPLFLFYLAVVITGLDLLEEIIIVLLLPQWKTDVKGLYWVIRNKPIS